METTDNHLCYYSNCFREATKKRGFLWVCDFHLHNPQKWGKDGMTFTGSAFVKKEVQESLGMNEEQATQYLELLEAH